MEKQTLSAFQEFSEAKFTKRVIMQKGDSTIFILNFMPGQKLPLHGHPGTEVYLLVLQGNGTFTIDDKDIEVTKDDVVHCAGNEQLAFANTGNEPVSLYVMLNKVPSEEYVQNI